MWQKVPFKETETKVHTENECMKEELQATQKLLEEERKAAIVEAVVKALEHLESDSK